MATTKDTNPKDALGIKKLPFSVLPLRALVGVALGMLEGALKYGRHNYRVIGVRASVYYDATMRHLNAWWEGQNLDPDSKVGLHHIDKAIASLMVLRDAMLMEQWQDDRPPASKDGWMDEANAKAAALVEMFPSPIEPYTEVGERAKRTNQEDGQ